MRHILIIPIGFALLAGGPSVLAAAKVTRTPAAMTFADRLGQDRIVSDGDGPYSDGAGGVSCVFFSSTGDASSIRRQAGTRFERWTSI